MTIYQWPVTDLSLDQSGKHGPKLKYTQKGKRQKARSEKQSRFFISITGSGTGALLHQAKNKKVKKVTAFLGSKMGRNANQEKRLKAIPWIP